VKRFRGGLVFEAHRLGYHSTLGLRVIKKKKKPLPQHGHVTPAILHGTNAGRLPSPLPQHRGTSLIRNRHHPGPYSRSYGGPRGAAASSYERGTPVWHRHTGHPARDKRWSSGVAPANQRPTRALVKMQSPPGSPLQMASVNAKH